jgi:hypothetical protein
MTIKYNVFGYRLQAADTKKVNKCDHIIRLMRCLCVGGVVGYVGNDKARFIFEQPKLKCRIVNLISPYSTGISPVFVDLLQFLPFTLRSIDISMRISVVKRRVEDSHENNRKYRSIKLVGWLYD